MKKLRIEIDETEEDIINFAMPVNDFSTSEAIGFLNQLIFQLNYQLIKAAERKSRKSKKPVKL